MNFRSLPLAIVWMLALCDLASAQLPAFGEKAAAVTPTIVADTKAIDAGKPFTVGVRFEIEREWYIYWRNVGDIGVPTSVEWQLPAGFKSGPLQWPLPHPHEAAGDYLNYVYEGETLLFAEITPPAQMPDGPVEIKAKLVWQMCNAEQCVPGNANLSLSLPVGATTADNAEIFAKYRAQIPKEGNAPFQVKWHREKTDEFSIEITGLPKDFKAEFFPLPPNREAKPGHPKLSDIAGDGARTITFPVEGGAPNLAWQGVLATVKGDAPREGWLIAAGDAGPVAAAPANETGFVAALWLALVGGVILNLMPCVFPVLGIKILGFVNQAGHDRGKVVGHGLIFTAGVVFSFWLLAGVLAVLRAGGAKLGWGFQLQSPAFVFALAIVMLIFALNMSGVFEFGISATSVGSDLQTKQGLAGSFFTGVLATVVATPCSAPFLAPALGAALALSTLESFAIFTAIAIGLSAPYLLLSIFPAAVKVLPRPGAWMETFKQFMAFPLYGTVGYLVWVLVGQLGDEAQLNALLGLVLVALGIWFYGRWTEPGAKRGAVAFGIAALLVAGLSGIWLGWPPSTRASVTGSKANGPASKIVWEKWSPAAVEKLRAQGRIIYVDFTARWCATCQTNKKIVFGSEEVLRVFAEKKVATLRADWTNADPEITAELARYQRSAVPFNPVWLPGKEQPVILPALLTPGIVLDVVNQR